MSPQQPPTWIRQLLTWLCQGHLTEGILGDLEELYAYELPEAGPLRANLRYAWRALGFFRCTFLKGLSQPSTLGLMMWKNHLKVSWRSLLKHRRYFAINTGGLTLALVCGLFAAIYALDELSYDDMHLQGDRIYRLYKEQWNPEKGTRFAKAGNAGRLAPAAVEQLPGVEQALRVFAKTTVLSAEKRSFITENVMVTDSNFFHFFDFPLLQGDPEKALVAPASIVLTQSMADKLFPHTEALGRALEGLADHTFTVTGVMADPPRTSHLQFTALISWSTTLENGPLPRPFLNNWVSQVPSAYLMLRPGADPAEITAQLKAIQDEHLPERAAHYFPKLQPLAEAYLHSQDILYARGVKQSSYQFMLVLLGTGLLVLLIAAVNYVNISLAKASKNLREVGIRKAVGSQTHDIRQRFLTETGLQVVLASGLGWGLLWLLLPEFNQLTGKSLPYSLLWHPYLLLGGFGFGLALTLLIGLYPAMMVGAYGITDLLRQHYKAVSGRSLRQGLLILQYTLSIGLIISTLFISQQTRYLISKTQRPGQEQLLVLKGNVEVQQKAQQLVDQLKTHSNILNVTASRAAIGGGTFSSRILAEGQKEPFSTQIFRVDGAFAETYDLQLQAGRFLDDKLATDTLSVIVNEAFLAHTGWETGVGKTLQYDGFPQIYQIVGVIDNFHYRSPAQEVVSPILMRLHPHGRMCITVRVGEGDLPATLAFMASAWESLGSRTPFNYDFVDDWFARKFRSEMQMLHTSTLFSSISIGLCLLGLFGLTSLLLEQRRREIGIRRVLGANLSGLTLLINRPFVGMAAFGFVLATPLAWWFVDTWIEQFAYPISITLEPFLVAGAAALSLSFLTVSALTLGTARANPVRAFD